MTAANRYLTKQFLPAYNRHFAVSAAEAGTAFVPWVGTSLADILCVQESRIVANDNTVRYQGRSLQIPPDHHRFHYHGASVRVSPWHAGGVSWPAMLGAVSAGGAGDRVRRRPDPSIGRPTDRGSSANCVRKNFGLGLKRSRETPGQIMCYKNRTTYLAFYRN